MLLNMMKGKIHRAIVTQADLNYEGSITIDAKLAKAAGIVPYEQVSIYDINNGSRYTTYCLYGKAESGTICLNGAAARMSSVGDLIIIVSYAIIEEARLNEFKPKIVLVDNKNNIKKIL